MKNIFLLIFILIFLYIICNGYIENFSVGCQINEKAPINISGSLTLSYIDKCNPTPSPPPPPPPPPPPTACKCYRNNKNQAPCNSKN